MKSSEPAGIMSNIKNRKVNLVSPGETDAGNRFSKAGGDERGCRQHSVHLVCVSQELVSYWTSSKDKHLQQTLKKMKEDFMTKLRVFLLHHRLSIDRQQ